MARDNEYSILLQGGLGNQLFGWAAAIALSQKNGGSATVKSDLLKKGQYQLNKYLNAPNVSLRHKHLNFPRSKNFYEQDYTYDQRFRDISSGLTLNGYFQSWKYFDDYQFLIRNTFTKLADTSQEYKLVLDQLKIMPFTALHIRRGDYINLHDYHGLTSREYFERARELILERDNTQKIVVFSDDVAIAKELVDWGDLYLGPSDVVCPVETLDLMSRATNIVGSNSSFSWWGAYLRDDNHGLRIMPRPWFSNPNLNDRDLLPKTWITLGI